MQITITLKEISSMALSMKVLLTTEGEKAVRKEFKKRIEAKAIEILEECIHKAERNNY